MRFRPAEPIGGLPMHSTRSDVRNSVHRTTPPRSAQAILALLGRVFSLLMIASVGYLALATSAGAATDSTLAITRPGSTQLLNRGASITPYGVQLPAGASCPADTQHHGQHVFSYLVPTSQSPNSVSFKTGVPDQGYGYITHGQYYGAINTAPDSGLVVEIPHSFTWTRLTSTELFPTGQHSTTWNGGLACADEFGKVTAFWNSAVTFTADPADPHGFTWHVSQHALPGSGFHVPTSVLFLVGAAVLAIAAIAYDRRHRAKKSAGSTDATSGSSILGAADRPAGRPPVGSGKR